MSSWLEVGLLVRVNPSYWEQTDLGETPAVARHYHSEQHIYVHINRVIILVIWKLEFYCF